MKYIERALERKFLHMSSFFKAVLITGARRALAKSDPILFFQPYKPPIIIDEIQKAPELFEQIKILCDETEERGLFWRAESAFWSCTVCQKMKRKGWPFQMKWTFPCPACSRDNRL